MWDLIVSVPDHCLSFYFEKFINGVLREEKEVILMGDFNKNLINEETDTEWSNLPTTLGLSQLVSSPTRITKTLSTLIDHLYTNLDENISRVHVCKLTLSDHYAIFGNRKLNSYVHNKEHHTITYRSIKYFDEYSFVKDLSEAPWKMVAAFDDVNDMVQTWNCLFLEIINKHAPIRNYRIKRKHQPEWLTSEILDCMKERDKFKINGKMDEYRTLRNKISSMIANAKNEMYQNKLEEGQNDPRTIWKIFRQFGACNKKGPTESYLGIKVNENFVTNEQVVADLFNEFFVNVLLV